MSNEEVDDEIVLGTENALSGDGTHSDDAVEATGGGIAASSSAAAATRAADPLPDGLNPERERVVAAKHHEVVSQVRRRMGSSSTQFRPDDDPAEQESMLLERATRISQQNLGAVAAAAESKNQQQQQRARAASLAAQSAPSPQQSSASPSSPASPPGSGLLSSPQLASVKQHRRDSSATDILLPAAGSSSPQASNNNSGNNNNNNNNEETANTNNGGANNSNSNNANDDDDDAATPVVALTAQQQQEQWRLRRKHVFIFSDAGKPIFTRWGDESDFSELFGILQVLMEMSTSNGLGALKHVSLGSHDVHFLSDDHLRFVLVSATGEPADTCQHQLRLISHCLLSGFPTVNKILERNSSYDVRAQLLHPAVFRSLIKSMNHEIPMIFQGVDCGFFDQSLRHQANEVLRKEGFAGYETDEDGGGHLMSLVVCRGKILSWGMIQNFQLSTDDLLLLTHFSERCCGSAAQLDNTWAPLCLPDYDKEGSFWVHVMQLVDTSGVAGTAGPSTTSLDGTTTAATATTTQQHVATNSSTPLLIQVATHTEAISSLKQSAARMKQGLAPIIDRLTRASAKVMSLPAEWAQLGVMHVLFNRWGVLAYTAPPLHAQERKHRKNFFRTLLQVRAEALALSKTARPFLMRASPYETICFSRKVVRLKSASMGKASAELFVTFLPGTEAGVISAAVNRIWDTMLNKDAWVQFVAARQNFNI